MNVPYISVIVFLWLLLGHAMRFIYALLSGGYRVPLFRLLYCYLFAPIAALEFMFDGVPELVVNWLKKR